MRFGYPGKLATSVRGRLKRLQSGANPAELQLGHDCSVEQCTALLGHLDARWYQLPRRASDAPRQGGRALRRRPAGRLFSRRRPHVRAQGSRGPAVVRRTRSSCRRWARSPTTTAAARTPSANGRGSDGRAPTSGARRRVARDSDARHRWILDQLVDRARATGRCASASSRASRSARDGELALSLRLWSGAPKADDAAAAFGGGRRGSAAAGAAARRDARRQGVPRAAAADVQSEPRAALARPRPRAAVPADAAPAARRRLRARRVRRDAPEPARRARPRREPPVIMPNRLAGETSPYLLQHAGNPVDWHPWGDEALALARARRASRSCCRSATRRATGAT